MKILHITPAYKPAFIYGGPTMSVAALCEGLSIAGHYIEVFTTTANGDAELSVVPNQPIITSGIKTWYFKRLTKDHTHFSPDLLRALSVRAREFDIIHIHSWWNLVAVLTCAIALFKKKKVVLSPRGMLSDYSFTTNNIGIKSLFHRFAGKWLLKKTHLHATSVGEQISIEQLLTPLSTTVLPNFVQLNSVSDMAAKKFDGYIKLIFFSRIEEKKGLDVLINALRNMKVSYHLTIAGDGDAHYIEQLKRLTVENQVDSHITWAGFFGNDKFNLMHRHDLLVLPSHNENFGNVVVESLSAGTAVLVSDGVGLSDYVLNHQFGWVCKAQPDSLSSAIDHIWRNCQPELNRIARQAPALVRKQFTGESLSKQYTDFYQQIYFHE